MPARSCRRPFPPAAWSEPFRRADGRIADDVEIHAVFSRLPDRDYFLPCGRITYSWDLVNSPRHYPTRSAAPGSGAAGRRSCSSATSSPAARKLPEPVVAACSWSAPLFARRPSRLAPYGEVRIRIKIGRRASADFFQPARLARSASRNSRRRIFPVVVIGSAATNSMSRGTSCLARCSRTKVRTSSTSCGLGEIPPLRRRRP